SSTRRQAWCLKILFGKRDASEGRAATERGSERDAGRKHWRPTNAFGVRWQDDTGGLEPDRFTWTHVCRSK
ncbi:MAG: hypothetical protein ACTSX8_04500, partial [Alphaproteobacteria bacterium]